jgi:hypothetical protein
MARKRSSRTLLAALSEVPVLELHAWLNSPVATRWRVAVARETLIWRGLPVPAKTPHEAQENE